MVVGPKIMVLRHINRDPYRLITDIEDHKIYKW